MRFSLNNPGSYNSAGKIASEFENVARYLVAAERGNKTIGELLAAIFNTDGEWDGPIEVRYDATRGLEYRVGSYKTDDEGWNKIADPADLRGASGVTVGDLNAPIFYGRQSFSGDGTQTAFSYFHKDTDDIFVFVNGVLQETGNYTTDVVNDIVTFNTAPSNGASIQMMRLRKDVVTGYRRSEQVAVANQVIFAFVHEADETIQVYRNGILQRPGGSYDYTASAAGDTITFTTGLNGGDLVTIVTVENNAVTQIGGLMLEDEYAPEGAVPYSKLSIPDGSIPQAKVNNLATLLANVGSIFVGAAAPASAVDKDLWIDTNETVLKFRSGGSWYSTNPNVNIPTFDTNNANTILKVNATGQFLEWGTVDTSGLIQKTSKGAANGVAALDGNAKVPVAQIPDIFALRSFNLDQSSISNTTYKVQRFFNQKVRIDKLAVKTGSGSCDVQISVDGSPVGDVVSASTTITKHTLSSSITIDATTDVKALEIAVTNNSAAANLEVTLAAANITA